MQTTVADNRPAARQNGGPQVNMDEIVQETQKRLMERPELLQMRMENESIMAECRVRPRDFEAIKRDLREQLEAFPEFAEAAIYRKPVGKDDSGQMKYAEGLSVRAAEALAEVYGYNRVRADITPIDDKGERMKVDATFTDFQKGKIWQDGGIVSVWYKASNGAMRRHNEDRFLNVVCKAEKSKYVREVILRSVNAGLKAWFQAECEKVMARTLTPERVAKIVSEFKTLGLNLEQLDAIVGRPFRMGWTEADRIKLASIYTALKEGETSIGELLSTDKKPDAPATVPGAVSAGDLTGAKVEQPTKSPSKAKPKQQPEESGLTETPGAAATDAGDDAGPAQERSESFEILHNMLRKSKSVEDVSYTVEMDVPARLDKGKITQAEADDLIAFAEKRKQELKGK